MHPENVTICAGSKFRLLRFSHLGKHAKIVFALSAPFWISAFCFFRFLVRLVVGFWLPHLVAAGVLK
jgi:hypothetical protein